MRRLGLVIAAAAMTAALAGCVPPTGGFGPGGAADGIDAYLARAHPDADRAQVFEGAGSEHALAFVYTPFPGGNAVALDVIAFERSPSGWAYSGEVDGLLGGDPRELAFGSDSVELTTTTLRPGDPRCCPSGVTRWRVDMNSLRARAI